MGHRINPYEGQAPASRNHQTIPSFRRDNHATGSGAGTATKAVIVFNSNVAATIRHIIVQTSAACTLQLLLNQQPFSLPIALGAGAIIRFAGTLIANNESLSISVSANSTLNFEVVWIKEFHVEHITTDTAVVYAGSPTGANSNVNIFDSTGQVLNSDGSGNLGVNIEGSINLPVQVTGAVNVIPLNYPVAPTHQIAPDQTGLPNPLTVATNGAFNTTPPGYRGILVTFKAGTVSGTSPTLIMQIQSTIGALADGSIAWANTSAVPMATGSVFRLLVYPTANGLSMGGAGSTQVNGPIPLTWRILYTPGGTTPSIGINEIYFDYLV